MAPLLTESESFARIRKWPVSRFQRIEAGYESVVR